MIMTDISGHCCVSRFRDRMQRKIIGFMMTNSQKSECNSNEKGVTSNSSLQSK
jgi:hypothetical protein